MGTTCIFHTYFFQIIDLSLDYNEHKEPDSFPIYEKLHIQRFP